MVFANITKYLWGFSVKTNSSVIEKYLVEYATSLISEKIVKVRGRIKKEPGDKFYIYDKFTETYYFNNYHYQKVLVVIKNAAQFNEMNNQPTTINESEVDNHTGFPVVFNRHTLNIKEPEDSSYIYQNDVIDVTTQEAPRHDVLEIQTGRGKALRDSTRIKIPGGWKNIGDMVEGDIITAQDGTSSKVTAIHPQGKVQLFEVKFEDNRRVECCAEHLWKVYYNDESKVVDTKVLIELLKTKNVYIDLPKPERFAKKPTSLAPYAAGSKFVKSLTKRRAKINLEMIHANTHERNAYLHGIIDGAAQPECTATAITTWSLRTARFIRYLARSLGKIATIKAIPNADRQYKVIIRSAKLLKMVSIKPTEIDNATCITIDHPDALYVAKDFIVTHNTAMAQKTMAVVGERVLLVTKAAYLDKWEGDITNNSYSLSLKPSEYIRVNGLEGFDKLIDNAKNGLLNDSEEPVKLIMLSSNTFDLWLKETLSNGSIEPIMDIGKILGAGLLVYDESHQLFRMNYWSFILFNIPRVMDLTGTIKPGRDKFLASRYKERFPHPCRYDGMEYNRYIEAYSIYYHTDNRRLIRRISKMRMYNHMEFEIVLLRKKMLLNAYFKMHFDILKQVYLKNRVCGQKALLFFSTKEMCTRFVEYLRRELPDLNIQRSIQGDDYEAFVNADIGVSTPGKSSTAVDIVGLVATICSVIINKEDTNHQLLGRLREDKKWGITPRIYYLHCYELQKHTHCLNERIKMLSPVVTNFNTLDSNYRI